MFGKQRVGGHPLKKRTAAVTVGAALAGSLLIGAPAGAVGSAKESSSGSSNGAETTFVVTIANISDNFPLSGAGAFTNPDGGDEPGPAFPGSSYSFDVYGQPGDHVRLASEVLHGSGCCWEAGAQGQAL